MRNYTSLEVMKASEVVGAFKEVKFDSEEEFREAVKKGTVYKAFVPPKNATMLKFRYYTPEGALIEQNNVPVVYDGTAVKDIITYYYLTDKSSGIKFNKATWESDGWKKNEVQYVTKDKRFLWTCTETLYSNTPDGGTGLLTEPCIASVYGEKGERGEKYLGHYTDSQTAYEDNTPDLFSGDYYLNTKDSYIYVYIEEDNAWGKITDFDDYRYNQSINDIFEAIESSTQKENFIRAKKIWVQNIAAAVARTETLFSNKITLTQGTDLDGKSTGGIIQSANYASGKSGWKIGYDGNAEFNNATVRGKIYATEGEFKGAITGGTIKIGENFSVTEDGTVTATGGTFDNITVNGNSVLNGYLYSNSVPFILCAMINFRLQDMNSATGIFHNYKTANIKSFKKRETGTYDVEFKNPITTKIFKAMGSDNVEHNYLTLLFLGNAHSSRDSFAHNCLLTTNFDLISIDNMNKDIIQINEGSMTATVSGAVLYCGDNNNDELVDFITIQGFFVGTEPVL